MMEFHEKNGLSLMKTGMVIVLKKIEARGFERDCVAIWIGWRKISEENRVAC